HGSWKFRPAGCFRTGAEITDSATNAPIAAFKRNWRGGGTLTFTDGQTFQISSKGFLRPVWTVRSQSEEPVLHLDVREKSVQIPGNMPLPEGKLTLLAIFVWHIVRQSQEEAASSAAIVAVAG